MKILGFIPALMTLFLLTSCNDDQAQPGLENWDPRICTSKTNAACGVDWFLNFKKSNFPDNVQILINDRIIIDECDPQTYWSVNGETSKEVEFKINDFFNLSGTETFSMRIFDLKNCTGTKSEHSFFVKQDYQIQNNGNEKQIFVQR